VILDELVADEKVTRRQYNVNGREHCTYQWANKQTANSA